MTKIVQHPSTPDHALDPRYPAEEALRESLTPLLETLMDFGFDCECDDFRKDFRVVVEILRALLYAQMGIHHDVQMGLNTKKDPSS